MTVDQRNRLFHCTCVICHQRMKRQRGAAKFASIRSRSVKLTLFSIYNFSTRIVPSPVVDISEPRGRTMEQIMINLVAGAQGWKCCWQSITHFRFRTLGYTIAGLVGGRFSGADRKRLFGRHEIKVRLSQWLSRPAKGEGRHARTFRCFGICCSRKCSIFWFAVDGSDAIPCACGRD